MLRSATLSECRVCQGKSAASPCSQCSVRQLFVQFQPVSRTPATVHHNPGVHHTGLDQEHITSHTSSAPHSSLHNSSHHRGPPLPQHKPRRSHHHDRCMTVWAQQQPHLLKNIRCASAVHHTGASGVHQVCFRCAWRRSNPQATPAQLLTAACTTAVTTDAHPSPSTSPDAVTIMNAA